MKKANICSLPTAAESNSLAADAKMRALASIANGEPRSVVLTPTAAPDAQPRDARAYWSDRINSRLTTGVTWIIEAGKDLLEAKERLLHGEFETMFETGQVKISIRTAQMLMRIASNGVLAKANNYSLLPPTLNSLYVLSGVKEAKLQNAIDTGRVSPSMNIADARALVPKSSASRNEGGTHDPGMVRPTYSETDLESAFARAATLLDRELQDCPDDKSRLRLSQKLVSRLLTNIMAINNNAANAASPGGQSSTDEKTASHDL